ncbi:MAG TPA: hypothetical protein PKH77_26060 [Anaerolineae bacterium]|nr:hypothetical protein [Anaerolineae bacterium]
MARKCRAPGAGRPPLPDPPLVIRPAIRLYAEDADLVEWFKAIPPGQRSRAIKAALRGGQRSVDLEALDTGEDDLEAALDEWTF